MKLLLDDIASLCKGKVIGDGKKTISGVNTIDSASFDEITFVSDNKYEKFISSTEAGAIFLKQAGDQVSGINIVLVDNPQLAFALIAAKLNPENIELTGVSESARIDPSVNIPENIYIGDNVTVEKGAVLGDGIYIGNGCRIGKHTSIGGSTFIYENVVIRDGSKIGDGCLIHPGVVIGADGFGLVKDGNSWVRIPQLGAVEIGNNVDIGANTTIDRGSIKNTLIGSGVKMDNLIQIGHNVTVGENTVIAAHTAIAGSSVIGKNCEIGGCVGIMDHSIVADDIKIGGGSVISGKLLEPGIYSSSIKAEKLSVWQKNVARLRKLGELAERVRKLEEK